MYCKQCGIKTPEIVERCAKCEADYDTVINPVSGLTRKEEDAQADAYFEWINSEKTCRYCATKYTGEGHADDFCSKQCDIDFQCS